MSALRELGPALCEARGVLALLIAPLEEACRDNAFLMEFYTWDISAYWHAIGGHSLAETIRVGLETLRGEVAGAEPDKAAP